MDERDTTMKTVTRDEAQRHFKDILDQVTQNQVGFTIEDDGKAVAVVTPIEVHERRQARRRFLDAVEEMQQKVNLSAEEADSLALEAVEAVRARST